MWILSESWRIPSLVGAHDVRGGILCLATDKKTGLFQVPTCQHDVSIHVSWMHRILRVPYSISPFAVEDCTTLLVEATCTLYTSCVNKVVMNTVVLVNGRRRVNQIFKLMFTFSFERKLRHVYWADCLTFSSPS